MSRIHRLGRGATAVATLAGLAACSSDVSVVTPRINDPIFASYVAIGNSITAGFQSGGINDSTQKRSYAVLLANAMGTRFVYPALTMPGCPQPVANFQTQALVGGGTTAGCSLRIASQVSDILNNVAVPGATSADPIATIGPGSSTLTTMILGGRTQVRRALEADPTFATVWIGNNDVLGPATRGVTVATGAPINQPAPTTQAQFQASYDAMIDTLTREAPGIKGVLIGVVNVTAAPILFPAAALANPTFLAGFSQFAGGPVTVLPNCTGSQSLISFAIVSFLRAQTTKVVGCEKNSVPGTPVGDWFVLDAQEIAQFNTIIAGYNAYIQTKANAIGFAYYDPNTLLAAQRTATGCIALVPNLASATAPYGSCMSLDGVHPGNAAHVLIAEELRKVINTKYGTNLPPIS